MKKVKITKLTELPDALHPNNIQEGFSKIGFIEREPTLGERFNVGQFSTSSVQEIIDSNTFKTYSSVYKWEILEDNQDKTS